MSSIAGNNIKVSIFGESHGPGVGAVIDGLPPGVPISMEDIMFQMERRAPGKGEQWSTKRKEPDIPQILSGIYKDKTTGTPLAAFIQNEDTVSSDYKDFAVTPRPGHADITSLLRYGGAADPRGSGHFSGRLTAGMVFAGAISYQILKYKHPVRIFSRLVSVGEVVDESDVSDINDETICRLQKSGFPVIDVEKEKEMKNAISQAFSQGDSLGGVIETVIEGFPSGVGDPIFQGMESRFASIIFSVPAVKGVEFGSGFRGSRMRGSQNNDVPYINIKENDCKADIYHDESKCGKSECDKSECVELKCDKLKYDKSENDKAECDKSGYYKSECDKSEKFEKRNPSENALIKKISYKSNNAGGITGGITTGMPIVIRTAIKPTSSISKEQDTVNLETGDAAKIMVKGRHDPCIAPRAIPVIEAVCGIVLLDSIM